MLNNPEAFPGKTFQDTLQDVYNNTDAKRTQIEAIMTTLTGLIAGSAQNAAIIAPLLKDLIEVSVKNDEHIVKVATIIQRIMSSEIQATGEKAAGVLSDEEKDKLLKEAETESLAELNAAVEEYDQLTAIKKGTQAVAGQLTTGSSTP